MTDTVTLQLPRGRGFRPVAHLVLGGLASRLELTVDVLDDIETAIDELLEHGDSPGHVTLSVEVDEHVLRATVGPFGDRVGAELRDEGQGLGLRRVLATVVDAVETDERDGQHWVCLVKRVEAPSA